LSDSGSSFSNDAAVTTDWVADEPVRLSLRCNLTVRACRAYGRLIRRLEVFFFFEVVIGLGSGSSNVRSHPLAVWTSPNTAYKVTSHSIIIFLSQRCSLPIFYQVRALLSASNTCDAIYGKLVQDYTTNACGSSSLLLRIDVICLSFAQIPRSRSMK
jgi:hypothetical protein